MRLCVFHHTENVLDVLDKGCINVDLRTSHKQLWSYGDGTSVYGLIRWTQIMRLCVFHHTENVLDVLDKGCINVDLRTSHKQLWSYGDGTSVYGLIRWTGARD